MRSTYWYWLIGPLVCGVACGESTFGSSQSHDANHSLLEVGGPDRALPAVDTASSPDAPFPGQDGRDAPTDAPSAPTVDAEVATTFDAAVDATVDALMAETPDAAMETTVDAEGTALDMTRVTVDVAFPWGLCGDGKLDRERAGGMFLTWYGEECDDGNTDSGDGCSSACLHEKGWSCPVAGKPCVRAVCGNAVTDEPEETCDDGNTFPGDGCSATCAIEKEWVCGANSSCYHVVCGDGLKELYGPSPAVTAEACDDGNTVSGDGCSATCALEEGWVCEHTTLTMEPTSPRWDQSRVLTAAPVATACHKPVCGDGRVDSNWERCDDGNTLPGDGCSSTCIVEDSSWNCARPGQPCARYVCGDGIVTMDEACDDGNTLSGDGCSRDCTLEAGARCPSAGGACVFPRCGDGRRETEQCDDGNTVPGDGCSAACAIEPGWVCSSSTDTSVCHRSVCGDGRLESPSEGIASVSTPGYESCDDGNTQSGDGCTSSCIHEGGWTCATPGQPCKRPACGNLRVEEGEDCDDGNALAGDGCAGCHVERGWSCGPLGLSCRPTCGDGKVQYFQFPASATSYREHCDDGNTVAGDGCSSDCDIEPGWQCGPAGRPCRPLCGNGVVDCSMTTSGTPICEQCDDGNTVAGDGCTSCRLD